MSPTRWTPDQPTNRAYNQKQETKQANSGRHHSILDARLPTLPPGLTSGADKRAPHPKDLALFAVGICSERGKNGTTDTSLFPNGWLFIRHLPWPARTLLLGQSAEPASTRTCARREARSRQNLGFVSGHGEGKRWEMVPRGWKGRKDSAECISNLQDIRQALLS